MSYERERGIILRRVKKQELEKQLGLIAESQTGGSGNIRLAFRTAVGFTPESESWKVDRHLNIAVINNEGVGYVPNEFGFVPVDVCYGDGFFTFTLEIASHFLVEQFLDEETVDLADHIRTFGDRLESNFYLWQNRLIQPEMSDVSTNNKEEI